MWIFKAIGQSIGATKKGTRGTNKEQNWENKGQNGGKKLQNWAFLGCGSIAPMTVLIINQLKTQYTLAVINNHFVGALTH